MIDPCVKCADTGRYTTTEHIETATMVSSGYSTHLCDCRKEIGPREGVAAWWSMENIFSAEVAIPIGNESAEVSVGAEVPISEDNYRVARRGNRYYPTLIGLVIGSEDVSLHSDTARQLAQALIRAADAADAIDIPDTDACGHWAPCECGHRQAAR